jgi:hypothetical protein
VRQTHIKGVRQSYMGRWRDRQTNSETGRQWVKKTLRQTDSETGRLKDRHKVRQTHRQTMRQTENETDRV